MEQFRKETRYVNLLKFCKELRDCLKHILFTLTRMHKLKLTFSAVKSDSKRGPGLQVNIKDIFEEAKAERTTVAEGWSTLGSAVSRTGSQNEKRIRCNSSIILCYTLQLYQNFMC